MIEIFETCQTKSIAKQTNRDESLIIRSILSADGKNYESPFLLFCLDPDKMYKRTIKGGQYLPMDI